MNSQQIEYFLSAVRHLNFTKAAGEFYTSQPTISRQIALLEAELGFELFKRDKGSLRLTAGGAIMAQELSKANKITRDAIARVELVTAGLEGEISIGYVSGTNTDLFVYPPTTEFTREYPAIRVTMESLQFSGLRNKLNSGELDIVYTFDFEIPSIQDILYVKCYTVIPIIAMSSAHPLAGKENLSPKDFCGETFLLPSSSESNQGRINTQNALRRLGIENAKLKNMNGTESMMFGVRSGAGVALVDTSMDFIFDNRYKYLQLQTGEEVSSHDIAAIWKRENLNPVIPIYIEVLKEYLRLSEQSS